MANSSNKDPGSSRSIRAMRKLLRLPLPPMDLQNLPIDRLPRFELSAVAFAITGRLANRFPRWVNENIERDWDVRGPGLQLIGLLSRMGEMTMSEAAEALDLTPGGITRIVKQLETSKLVTRSENPKDRRQSFLILTPVAKEKANKLMPLHDSLMARATETLSEDELRAYLKAAIKLSDALREK